MKRNRIKKIVYAVFLPITFILSFFVSLRLGHFFEGLKNRIFSYHVKRKFSVSGKNFSLSCPFDIFGFKYIRIGDNVSLPKHTRINVYSYFHNQVFNPSLTIEDDVIFNEYIHIACINKIVIKSGVLVGSNVLITDHFHGNGNDRFNKLPKDRELISKGEIVIGKNTWIGDNCVILPGVNIGDNCIIGAGAVVTRSIPSGSIAVGVPAKVIENK